MTVHTVHPAYDEEFPATLSTHILTDLLKGELGFNGVIVSDAIGMAAILKKWPLSRACAMAIEAGIDTYLIPSDVTMYSRVLHESENVDERKLIIVRTAGVISINDVPRLVSKCVYLAGISNSEFDMDLIKGLNGYCRGKTINRNGR